MNTNVFITRYIISIKFPVKSLAEKFKLMKLFIFRFKLDVQSLIFKLLDPTVFVKPAYVMNHIEFPDLIVSFGCSCVWLHVFICLTRSVTQLCSQQIGCKNS